MSIGRRGREIPARLTFLLGTMLCALASTSLSAAEIIHRQRSLYQTVIVTREPTRVCMQFTVRRDQRNQTCRNPRRPRQMIFPYTRMMMTGLAFQPAPQRILVVGLGGGTLPEALEELYPAAVLDVVEIDPVVVEVATDYFAYEPGPNTEVHTQDARVFTKRARQRVLRARAAKAPALGYDLILLDAFNGDYIPEHLLTREYLQETRDLLNDGGIVVANTFVQSRLFDHESTTYQSVFDQFLTLSLPLSGNRIVIAGSAALDAEDLNEARRQTAALVERLAPYDVDLADLISRVTDRVDWDTSARVLTDQYSPANLLKGKQRRR